MKQTWITSDLHFFHKNIIKYCDRQFVDEYDMNDVIVAEWNSVVASTDDVIVVGDISAGLAGRIVEFELLLKRLKGNIMLIRGNHDHLKDHWFEQQGIVVKKHHFIDGLFFTHKPVEIDNLRMNRSDLHIKMIVHGHVHNKGENLPEHFNVAWDWHNRLINMTEIQELIQK